MCSGQPLTPALRAVEVFIRDKYERKRYYDKEALATARVSIVQCHIHCHVVIVFLIFEVKGQGRG